MPVTVASLLRHFTAKEITDPKSPPSPYDSTNPTIRNIRSSLQVIYSVLEPQGSYSSIKDFTTGSKERHTLFFADHALVVRMDSFNATERLLSNVKSPDTVLKMNRMLDNLSDVVKTPYAGALRNFFFEVFRHNADTCTYQTDYDEGEYTLMLHDAKHRTQITLSIETLAQHYALEIMTEVIAA